MAVASSLVVVLVVVVVPVPLVGQGGGGGVAAAVMPLVLPVPLVVALTVLVVSTQGRVVVGSPLLSSCLSPHRCLIVVDMSTQGKGGGVAVIMPVCLVVLVVVAWSRWW